MVPELLEPARHLVPARSAKLACREPGAGEFEDRLGVRGIVVVEVQLGGAQQMVAAVLGRNLGEDCGQDVRSEARASKVSRRFGGRVGEISGIKSGEPVGILEVELEGLREAFVVARILGGLCPVRTQGNREGADQ